MGDLSQFRLSTTDKAVEERKFATSYGSLEEILADQAQDEFISPDRVRALSQMAMSSMDRIMAMSPDLANDPEFQRLAAEARGALDDVLEACDEFEEGTDE